MGWNGMMKAKRTRKSSDGNFDVVLGFGKHYGQAESFPKHSSQDQLSFPHQAILKNFTNFDRNMVKKFFSQNTQNHLPKFKVLCVT